MPRRILVIFTVFIWYLVYSGHSRADTLVISIEGLPKAQGTLMVQVFGSEAGFKGEEKSVASFMQSVHQSDDGSLHYSLSLPPGTYAARVMHDLNDNGELDANFVGIPNEPWGFSNNAMGSFGPPKWQEAQFELQGEAQQTIHLNK